MRITGSDEVGKSKLDYFRSTTEKYPVIATTSKLLSTGADIKMTKLIVLDEMIGSMTEFKQILGRGTRLREKEGKTHFAVMDFRNVTRLFADPDWDGPLEIDEEFGTSKGQGKDLPRRKKRRARMITTAAQSCLPPSWTKTAVRSVSFRKPFPSTTPTANCCGRKAS